MRRRDFLKAGIGGMVAAGVGMMMKPAVAQQNERALAPDPDTLAETAVAVFMDGKKTCSEALLLAGSEALGIESDLIPDIALGLGGGIGLQGKTCGALTGSAMVLSLAAAGKHTEYRKKKMAALRATGVIHKRFAEKFGTTDCRQLCGLDLTTTEGRRTLERRVKTEKCKPVVEACARMLAEAIEKV